MLLAAGVACVARVYTPKNYESQVIMSELVGIAAADSSGRREHPKQRGAPRLWLWHLPDSHPGAIDHHQPALGGQSGFQGSDHGIDPLDRLRGREA